VKHLLRRQFEATLAALEVALDPEDRELDLVTERPQLKPPHQHTTEYSPAGAQHGRCDA
jgi:hypothetical protein